MYAEPNKHTIMKTKQISTAANIVTRESLAESSLPEDDEYFNGAA